MKKIFGILSNALTFLTLILILVGLHSIDNAWNIAYIENEFDTKILDKTISGMTLTKEHLYDFGTTLILISIISCVLATILREVKEL